MLNKLSIENFQAHHKLEIVFNPHVTTIIGPSDAGKSAVIRALKWLATNKPAGDAFIREGAKSTTVILELDGTKIIRKRSASINAYWNEMLELTAFGNEPPQEVLRTLNLSPINFQGQHDSPFWFSETAGEVSRQLNQIVDLGVIDAALANVDKVLRAARASVQIVEDRLAKASELRKSLTWVKDADQDLVSLEAKAQEAAATQQGLARLGELLGKVRNHADTQAQAHAAAESAARTLAIGDRWGRIQAKIDRMSGLLKSINRLKQEASIQVPNMDPILNLRKAWDLAREKAQKLETALDSLVSLREDARSKAQQAAKAHKLFEAEIGERCPLCGK